MQNYDMEALAFDSFYRSTGVRFQDRLASPVLTAIEDFELPLNSQYHYLGDGSSVGPVLGEFPLDKLSRIIQCQHVYDYIEPQGTFRQVQEYISFMPLIKNYHRQNTPDVNLNVSGLEKVSTPTTLTVRSYAGLMLRYIYPKNEFTIYNKWRNRWNTIINTLAKEVEKSERNHFMVIDVTKSVQTQDVLASISKHYDYFKDKKPRQEVLRKFNSESALLFFQFWLWLGDERKRSLFSLLDEKYLGRINIIFKSGNYVSVLNLGLLNSFRKDPKDEDSVGLETVVIQKRFRAMFVRLGNIEEHIVDEQDEIAAVTAVNSAKEDKSKIVVIVKKDNKGKVSRVIRETPEVIHKDDRDEIKSSKDTPTLDDTKVEPEISDDDVDKFLKDYDFGVDAIGEFNEDEIISIDGSSEDPDYSNVEDLLVPPSPPSLPPETFEAGVMEEVKRLVASKSLTAGELRRYQDLASRYKTARAPEVVRTSMGNNDATIEDGVSVKKEDIALKPRQLKPIRGVLDAAMLTYTVDEIVPTFVDKLMHRYLLSAVMSLQMSGIAVSDIRVEEEATAVSEFYRYSFKIHPVGGRESTETFKIPKVDENGTMTIGGVKYYLKTQRTDVPIRKVNARRVAITTHYGKLFIDRLSLQAADYSVWLRNRVTAISTDLQNKTITDLRTGMVFDKQLKTAQTYSALAMNFQSMTVRPVGSDGSEIYLMFNHEALQARLNPVSVKVLADANAIAVGWDKGGNVVGVLPDGMFRVFRATTSKDLGYFEDMIGVDISKAPVEFAVAGVFGKPVALGLILGYHLGLNNVIKMLGVKPRIVPADKQIKRSPREYVLKFADYALIFDRKDRLASLVYGGLRNANQYLGDYKLSQMNNQDTYIALMTQMGLPNYVIRELDIIYTRLVDSVSKTILLEMGEPTDTLGLYLRSLELLTSDQHPEEVDGRLTLLRGYERFSETVYKELTNSIRGRGRTIVNGNKSALALNPEAVWQKIIQDSSKEVTNDINPIQNRKQSEIVTYGGSGGRTKETMVKRTRVMPESDKGLISEAGVDSGSVGITTFTPPNPTIKNLLGMTDIQPASKLNITNYLSTSALLAPAADRDSMNRIGFISIQQSHTIATHGAVVAPYHTGYEHVIGHRTSDSFATSARHNGKVVSNDGKVIVVECENGKRKAVELGIRYGRSAGSLYPHNIVTDLKVGDEVKEGDFIAYNTNFFEKHWLNPQSVAMKTGVMMNMAFKDILETFEDGCVISDNIAGKMEAPIADVRRVVMDFSQVPHNVAKVGDEVEYETILCTIEDPVIAGDYKVDEATLEGLRNLSRGNPRAQTRGIVTKVEVYYHGELNDMNEELRAIVGKYDKALRDSKVALGKKVITGQVSKDFRIDGKPLMKNQVVFCFYTTTTMGMGVGDKLVLGNQMKCTVTRKIVGENKTVSGIPIDAMFAYNGANNRIVESMQVMGTMNRNLQQGSKLFAQIARGEIEPPRGLTPPKK